MNVRTRLRRGTCPGLSAPMQTGDGLLARLTPSATLSLDQFAGLCKAARRHGNGIIEITSRGSIQVRGLGAASAPLFAADIAALAIEASDGIPVLADPLSEDHAPAAEIRAALATLAAKPSAKVSVAINLGLAADVGLRMHGDHVHIALAALPLGAVPRECAADAVRRLLETLAKLGPDFRMGAAIERSGIEPFKFVVAALLLDIPPPTPLPSVELIGFHHLRSGIALGIGLPFGHSDADMLTRLIDMARDAGASGVRTAPGRALLVMGLSPAAAPTLAASGKSLGFIVDPADPRRRIVACAGAPICASGEIPARLLAPLLAEAAGSLGAGEIIHVSGCIKGCAYPSPAAVTVTGRAGVCDIVIGGAPSGSVTADALPPRLVELLRSRGARS